MSEVAPQAAEGMTEDDAKALEVLRLFWEPEYSVGYDDEHGWWAARSGVIGHIITAAAPEELNEMMSEESGTGR
jgi:hypothetical protein